MKGFVPWNKGLRGYNAGEKSPNWQGGITSENTKLRRSFEYKNWVFSVFKRDNFTCQHCHKKTEISGRLVADHVLPFSVFPDKRLDLFNGQTLCENCHKDKTKKDWKFINGYGIIIIRICQYP